ncbi:MAG: S1 RNA-binding domain-containing protein [Actinomycetota bacterium]
MTRHVVVDGSNLATEGRSHPSLVQLNEAVLAYMAEHPGALVTVVVDATFGHRIDPREVPEFDEAVANNELVAPPAGAIGRGDAFVLAVANRVNAVVLSNDSFQEFHGTYAWLFDEGRLVGGKPVPHVGWVFVPRLPVRGAVSRSAVKQSRRKRDEATAGTVRVGSPEASQPMPVPTAPPPGPAAVASAEKATEKAAGGSRRRGGRGGKAAEVVVAPVPALAPSPAPAPAGGTRTVNEADVFLAFVAEHPLGTSVNAVVESYSSHGAYVNIGEVRGYVPLRLMADPAPRSAREFMKIGDAVTLVVESYSPERRSVDLALAAMATHRAPAEVAPAKRPRRTKAAVGAAAEAAAAAEQAPVVEVPVVEDPVAEASVVEVPAKAAKPSRRKAKPAEPVAEPVTAPVEAVVEAAPAKQPARRKKAAAPAPEPVPEVPAAPAPAPRTRKKAAAPVAPVEPVVERAARAKPRRRTKA